MTRGILTQPATDDPLEFRFLWTCGDCMTQSVSHRNAAVALADSLDHRCPADPLIAGQESLFGGAA